MGLAKTIRNLTQKRQSPRRDINPDPPEYEARAMFPSFSQQVPGSLRLLLNNNSQFTKGHAQWNFYNSTQFKVRPLYVSPRRRERSVCIATGYRIHGRASTVLGRDKRSVSSPQCPDRLQGPPSLLSNGYGGILPWR
jgi:hypothetical protein